MQVITVAACASCGAVWLAALMRVASPPRRPAAPEIRAREEDRVRPAVDADGEPIWVEADDVFWHEIVAWPERAGRRPAHPRRAAGA